MTYEAKRDDKDAMEKELGYKIHEWNEIYADPKHRNLIKKKKGLLEQDTSIHSVTDVRIYDDVILSKDRYIAGDPDLHIRTIRTFFMNGVLLMTIINQRSLEVMEAVTETAYGTRT